MYIILVPCHKIFQSRPICPYIIPCSGIKERHSMESIFSPAMFKIYDAWRLARAKSLINPILFRFLCLLPKLIFLKNPGLVHQAGIRFYDVFASTLGSKVLFQVVLCSVYLRRRNIHGPKFGLRIGIQRLPRGFERYFRFSSFIHK